MRGRLTALVSCAGLVAAALATVGAPAAVTAAAAGAGPRCDPFTDPDYAGAVPSPREVIGFGLGDREVTPGQSDRYLRAVARASDRVDAGVAAVSHEGRPLRYAIVGSPRRVELAQEAAELLREPGTSAAEAADIAAEAPAILWVAGNVHGDEESGADASLRVLRDLADRTDCAARSIRAGAIAVILPIQNPDGRVIDQRQNIYGFDMNRDWFARTQPETDGKVELMRDFPPTLMLDAHEMGGRTYFFPPNADPIYHEVNERSIRWIDDVYGAAMARTFDRFGIDFFNRGPYDFFAMIYGDTVPTSGFLGAGITLEKGGDSPISVRTREQYLAIWSSFSAGARQHEKLLRGISASTRQAYQQGVEGRLEPNQVYNPGNDVTNEVPDIRVRHWFIRDDDPDRADEVARIVRRLQRMDVEVNRLTAPLDVGDYTPYGRAPRDATLPAGTYWVPMAQAQKHWVQAMLADDTYVPFPYFYDISAWSLPMLGDVEGGRSGLVLDPQAEPAPPADEPEPEVPADPPSIATYQLSRFYTESPGWQRWLLAEEWGVPFRRLDATDIRGGGLAGVDVLMIPDGSAQAAERNLGVAGARQLRQWLADGGRLVAWRGGARFATRMALTSARWRAPTSDIPGSLLRVDLDTTSPVTEGLGSDAWMFYAYDPVMTVTDPDLAPVSYPDADGPDWFVSGFARGADELSETAAMVDEAYGDGRVTLFPSDPNFRGYTTGTQQLVLNAVFGPEPGDLEQGTAAERQRAARSERRLPDLSDAVLVTVREDAAAGAAAALGGEVGAGLVRRVALPGPAVRFVVSVSPERERKVADLAAAVSGLGDDLLAFWAPR